MGNTPWYKFESRSTLIASAVESALADEKLNPSQPAISRMEGESISTRERTYNYTKQYESLEVVNRGVNMIVDDAADMLVKVGDQAGNSPVRIGVRKVSINRLLNIEPNPFQDINTFRRNLVIDLIIDGNIFFLYNHPL